MKITVLGAGAIGSLIGGLLSKDNDVTLIGRTAHMEAIARAGLKIDGLEELTVKPRTMTDLHTWEPAELLILTVKSYDTSTAIEQVNPLIGNRTIILSIQNGLGNIEKIAKHVPNESIIAGITSHGAIFTESGRVRHTGTGDTIIGRPFSENDKETELIAQLLTKAGFETSISDNIRGEIWAKVIVNAAINPLTAILRKKNGFLLEQDDLISIMTNVIEESITVAESIGIDLPDRDLLAKTFEVAQNTAENRSSMLQDVERGRRTEIDQINGEIIKLGREKYLNVNTNSTLHAMVKSTELHNRNKY